MQIMVLARQGISGKPRARRVYASISWQNLLSTWCMRRGLGVHNSTTLNALIITFTLIEPCDMKY